MNGINSTSAEYRQYHAIARHWASDVDFFKIETVFLHHLLDDYFIRLSGPKYVEGLKSIGKKLLQLEKDKYSTDIHLIEHLKNLEGQTEDLVFARGEFLADTHEQMEKAMTHLNKTYRDLKKELFFLIQQVIKAQQDTI
ncbi:hypothetical protein [Pedobacter mendelii]|uniref:Chemoreceptor zinc-binding domain-containing protein n=1 Tax=Pedobacter mendelii TaxID=1908240 RepID=A0ABQ2BIF8_9SPHI|nr:hypothetical protein [Pedobacter mendelii]GGI26462.1 hypothetical protein GCM10008119_22780 [Pedobacter mendelii]